MKDNHVLAVARTGDGGRPHAEALALAQAGDAARGATAYVTLEPCSHFGKTPPCAEALIRAGIARVVIGCTDPDPRVSGRGIAMLQAAGIETFVLHPTMHSDITRDAAQPSPPAGEGRAERGVRGYDSCTLNPDAPSPNPLPQGERAFCASLLENPFYQLNRGFFRRVTDQLPYVSMKLATSRDYFMARADGGSQWLTGAFARAHGQRMRGQHDAMLTGIGTVLADNPLLTVRAPNAPHPALVRVVADRALRLPLDSKLVKTASQSPLILLTTPEGIERAASNATDLRERGATMIALEDMSANSMLSALAAQGLTRVMVEAGPTLSTAFLDTNLVDTLHHYHAPITLGNTGAAPINALEGVLARARRIDARALGDDSYASYELK